MSLDISKEFYDSFMAEKTGWNSIYVKIKKKLNGYYTEADSVADEYWYLNRMNDLCNKWLHKNGGSQSSKKDHVNQLQAKIQLELPNLIVPVTTYLDERKSFLEKDTRNLAHSFLGAYTLNELTRIYEKDLEVFQLNKKEIEILKYFVSLGKVLLPDREEEFKERLNYLMATGYNKRGEGSTAFMTRGGSLAFGASFDFAKLFVPVEGVSLEASVSISGQRMSQRVIAVERQNDYSAIQQNESESKDVLDNAYLFCLMNMIGWSGGVKLGAQITASIGMEAKTPDIIQNIEIASLALTAKAEAKAKAEVAGEYLTISDPTPKYYDSVLAMKTPIYKLINDLPPNDASAEPVTTQLTLWSHAYDLGAGLGVYAGAKAEAGVESLSCEIKAVDANVTARANIKMSYYRFQTVTDPSTKVIKTQDTKLSFKQVGVTASAETGLKTQCQSKETDITIGAEKKYNAINTIAYESAIAVWTADSPNFLKGSGYITSTSVSVYNLNLYYAEIAGSETYLKALAGSLCVNEKQLSDFLNDTTLRELYADVTQLYPGALFIEASFTYNPEEPLPPEKGAQPKNLREHIKKSTVNEKNLESIRLCYRREDNKDNSYSRFKLGLNLGIAKLNINIGKIESAGTSEMINLHTNWIQGEKPLNQSVIHPKLFI